MDHDGDPPPTAEADPPKRHRRPPARKSKLVPLTLLGVSALTLGLMLPDDDEMQRNLYRTLADCEADNGPARCEAGTDEAGRPLALGPHYQPTTSSWFSLTSVHFGGSGSLQPAPSTTTTIATAGAQPTSRSIGVRSSQRGGFGSSAAGHASAS